MNQKIDTNTTDMNTTREKKVLKNTLFLYARMIIVMGANLYTARVVLDSLGVDDYGIYNVVGGIVLMFSILSSSITAAITRFITYEIGVQNKTNIQKIFSTSINIQIFLGIIVIVLAELLGLWFLNNKMVIDAKRVFAANLVFQFSILTFFINLISIPYNSIIIAYEKFSIFSYIAIFEALGKFLVAFLLVFVSFDRLIAYACLQCVLAIVVRFIYTIYCKYHFPETAYSFSFDKHLLLKMLKFSGWNFIGASSAILRDEGGNMLLNVYCGPSVNAARGIAFQVSNAIYSFTNNFVMAVNPQIIKSYASKDYEYMLRLVYRSARMSFYLLWLIGFPLLLNLDYVLSIWLVEVPLYTANFIYIILLASFFDAMSAPLITAMLATGNIRNYQLIVGGLQMLNFPLSLVFLANGFLPVAVFVVYAVLAVCCFIARLIILRYMINLSILYFLRYVVFRCSLVSMISVLPALFFLKIEVVSFLSLFFVSFFVFLWSVVIIYVFGIEHKERIEINLKVISFVRRAKWNLSI